MGVPNRALTYAQEQKILAYYERAAPIIAKNFPDVPLIEMYYPRGLDEDAAFSGPAHEPLPHTIPSASAVTPSGQHVYPACAENTILWLAHRYAVGFLSWFPTPSDADRATVAHISMKPVAGATQQLLKDAMRTLRAALRERDLDAIPILHGNFGAALFLPCADTPRYEEARTLLHAFVNGMVTQHPTQLVHEKRPHEQHTEPRIECTVVSNAVGRGCLVPYSLNGGTRLPVVTPIAWDELDAIANGDVTATNARDRFAEGDVYSDLVPALANQRLAELAD